MNRLHKIYGVKQVQPPVKKAFIMFLSKTM